MVPVGGGHWTRIGFFSTVCEILTLRTVLARAASPFRRQSAQLAAASSVPGQMAVARANIHKYEGHVAVLINHVGQMVELVAGLDVVGSRPAALEECHVLVELVVLAGIDLSDSLIEGSVVVEPAGLALERSAAGCTSCCLVAPTPLHCSN